MPATLNNGQACYASVTDERPQSTPVTSGHSQSTTLNSPYAGVQDHLNNVGRFQIIDTTLREGEQFANAYFDTEKKIAIAKALDEFGVDYIELTNPSSSPQSYEDCKTICKLGLRAKILAHIRCHMDDARLAVETGCYGVNMLFGTSSYLQKYSHGKDMEYIERSAVGVIEYLKSHGVEVRFSSEDSFRSNLVDLLHLYRAMDMAGVARVGVADTVGCATPRQVYDLIRTLRSVVRCDIETHFHNDTGCAVANAFCALEAGATHINTCILGIGERNGITPLGGLMARMIVADRDYVRSKYNLEKLAELEDLVAEIVDINVPFNNYITGYSAFTHRAGIRTMLAGPEMYEILDPADFGVTRYIHIGSRIIGWNAIKSRVDQLGLALTDAQVKDCTLRIKALADGRSLHVDDADRVIREYHQSVALGDQRVSLEALVLS